MVLFGGLFLAAGSAVWLLSLVGPLLVLEGTSTEVNLTAAVLTGAFIVAALPTRGGGAGNGPRDLGAAVPVTGVLTGALIGALVLTGVTGLAVNMAGELKVCGRVLLLTGVTVAVIGVSVEVMEDEGTGPMVALIELGGVLLLTGLTGAALFLAVLKMSSK